MKATISCVTLPPFSIDGVIGVNLTVSETNLKLDFTGAFREKSVEFVEKPSAEKNFVVIFSEFYDSAYYVPGVNKRKGGSCESVIPAT